MIFLTLLVATVSLIPHMRCNIHITFFHFLVDSGFQICYSPQNLKQISFFTTCEHLKYFGRYKCLNNSHLTTPKEVIKGHRRSHLALRCKMLRCMLLSKNKKIKVKFRQFRQRQTPWASSDRAHLRTCPSDKN